MSKKLLTEFFVALGVGNHDKANSILETVVRQKLNDRINENAPGFPTREFNGNAVDRYDDEPMSDDEMIDDETDDGLDHEQDKWDLIAQYVAIKQVMDTDGEGDLQDTLDTIRDQLVELGDESLDQAEMISDAMLSGEYEEIGELEVPDDFQEMIDDNVAELTDLGAVSDESDDVDLDDTDDDLEEDADLETDHKSTGMAGLGRRFAKLNQPLKEDGLEDTDDLDDTSDLDDVDGELDVTDDQDATSMDIRSYIEDCVLNSDMDIDQCYHAVRTQFGNQYSDSEIDQIYNDVIDNLPELN